MAKSGVLTGVVALVLGIVIGVVGLLAAAGQLSPSAQDATTLVQNQAPAGPPPAYGSR